MPSRSPSHAETVGERLEEHLRRIYPTEAQRRAAYDGLGALLEARRPGALGEPHRSTYAVPDQATVVISAYPDHVRAAEGAAPLRTLGDFLTRHCAGLASHVHLLPFHTATSDDGFAVADYDSVDPALGDWADLRRLGPFGLVVDAVVNHVSASHPWARALRAGEAAGERIATARPGADLGAVVRPRTSPLLLDVETARGTRQVWCTFSHDQWDLDYGNPDTLVAMTGVLANYVDRGAAVLRLDAVGFLWKEEGSPSIHLAQTHEVIRLWRTVLDAVAPGVLLLTETNVPYADNVSYLGRDQAQLAYHFSLPPVMLDGYQRGDASHLVGLLGQTAGLPDGCSLLTFLASHDGIGLRGAEGILGAEEVADLVTRTEGHGALVSYRAGRDGPVPYELNTTYFDALVGADTADPDDEDLRRFVGAHAAMLALPGVPAIYLSSFFGGRNWTDGPAATGQNRSINRGRLDPAAVDAALDDPGSTPSRVLAALGDLLRARRTTDAFRPDAPCEPLPAPAEVLAVERRSPSTDTRVLCLHNMSGRRVELTPELVAESAPGSRLLAGGVAEPDPRALGPYEYRWVARHA